MEVIFLPRLSVSTKVAEEPVLGVCYRRLSVATHSIWVIVIDTSGSMREEFSGSGEGPGINEVGNYITRIEAAKDHALKQITGITSGDIAVIAFDANARLVAQGPVSSSAAFASPINQLEAHGSSTNIGKAITFCLEQFVLPQNYRRVWVQFITDGLSNEGDPIAAAEHFADTSDDNNVLSRIDAILIDPNKALERDEGEKIALAICEPTGGSVKSVTSSIQLEESLEQLARVYAATVGEDDEDRIEKIATRVAGLLGIVVVITGIFTSLVEKPLLALPIAVAALLLVCSIIFAVIAFGKKTSQNPFFRGPREEDLGFPKPSWKYSKRLRRLGAAGLTFCVLLSVGLVILAYSLSNPVPITPTPTP